MSSPHRPPTSFNSRISPSPTFTRWICTPTPYSYRTISTSGQALPPANRPANRVPRAARPLSILEPAYIPPPADPIHWPTVIEQLLADLRYGARILTKSPAFSAAAIALIAAGIGGNTAVYSLVHSILSKPAPGVHASGLVSFAPALDRQPH